MANGLEQVQAYAALAGEHFQPGDLVDIRELGRAEVVEVLPGSMLKVRTAQRCLVLIRSAVCKKIR